MTVSDNTIAQEKLGNFSNFVEKRDLLHPKQWQKMF